MSKEAYNAPPPIPEHDRDRVLVENGKRVSGNIAAHMQQTMELSGRFQALLQVVEEGGDHAERATAERMQATATVAALILQNQLCILAALEQLIAAGVWGLSKEKGFVVTH